MNVILIISGSLGEIYVPKIHECKNILKIIVFCGSKEYHEKWGSKFSKVTIVTSFTAVETEANELIDKFMNERRGIEGSYVN